MSKKICPKCGRPYIEHKEFDTAHMYTHEKGRETGFGVLLDDVCVIRKEKK